MCAGLRNNGEVAGGQMDALRRRAVNLQGALARLHVVKPKTMLAFEAELPLIAERGIREERGAQLMQPQHPVQGVEGRMLDHVFRFSCHRETGRAGETFRVPLVRQETDHAAHPIRFARVVRTDTCVQCLALSGRPFFDSKRLAKSRGWFVADRARLLERRARELRGFGVRVDVCVVWEDPGDSTGLIHACNRFRARCAGPDARI